jgi:AcrR family transcriptional regulator
MRERISRRKQVEQNHVQLMEAARKVFVRRGYHAASLDEVASTAGFTKGAVYARFASKAELMLALLEERIAQMAEQMERALAAAVGEEPRTETPYGAALAAGLVKPKAKTRVGTAVAHALARQWAAISRVDADWSLLVLEFRVHAARDRGLSSLYCVLHSRLRVAIARAFHHAELAIDPADLARLTIVLADGFTLERAVDPDAFPAKLYELAASALLPE